MTVQERKQFKELEQRVKKLEKRDAWLNHQLVEVRQLFKLLHGLFRRFKPRS